MFKKRKQRIKKNEWTFNYCKLLYEKGIHNTGLKGGTGDPPPPPPPPPIGND